jgi:hypothetical protein
MSWGGGWTDECVRAYASGCRRGRGRICGALMGCDYAGDFGAVGLAGGFGAVGIFETGVGDGGDFADHLVGVLAELGAADVADGGVEGAED